MKTKMEYPNTEHLQYSSDSERRIQDELNHLAQLNIKIYLLYVKGHITEEEKKRLEAAIELQELFFRGEES